VKIAWLTLMSAAVAVAGEHGMTPRSDPADYAAHSSAKGVTIAASLIPADQLKKVFSADVSRGYVVFEVAVYPSTGVEPEVATNDFTLRTPPEATTMRAAGAEAVAASAIPYDKHTPSTPSSAPGNVHVYTESTIGYESGGNGRRGGVYTGGGVTVTNYPPPAAPPSSSSSKDQRRDELQIALQDKALPEGRVAAPVAGYLYFPKPSSRHKIDTYELAWYGQDGTIRLQVRADR
jgi:hypothetical protein